VKGDSRAGVDYRGSGAQLDETISGCSETIAGGGGVQLDEKIAGGSETIEGGSGAQLDKKTAGGRQRRAGLWGEGQEQGGAEHSTTRR